MQSGTTGINIPRIYNPIKQARDHDPNGVFVRRWIPALRQVPDTWLFEPWRMPPELRKNFGISAEHDIATPIVDLENASREAKRKLFERRGLPTVKAAKKEVIDKHASRKRPTQPRQTPTRRRSTASPPPSQQTLDFS